LKNISILILIVVEPSRILLYILLILSLRIFKRFHRAPDPLTILLDQVMLENDASWLVFLCFSDDIRSPSAQEQNGTEQLPRLPPQNSITSMRLRGKIGGMESPRRPLSFALLSFPRSPVPKIDGNLSYSTAGAMGAVL
jgi:hypothetical protein